MTIKRRSLHIVPVSHSLSLRSANDVTIDCWWRHNDQITWKVISNSLDIDFIHGDIHGRSFTHRPRVSLAGFSFCWWRYNRLLMTSQWPDNCDAITWTVISNSLDIDFIHGDIHSRSCKKNVFRQIFALKVFSRKFQFPWLPGVMSIHFHYTPGLRINCDCRCLWLHLARQ